MIDSTVLKSFIKKSQLFSELNDKSLDEVAQAASLKNISKGELLFYEGDPAYAFFIVGEGKVKIYKLSGDGKEQILMIANPGDSFAEAAMFGDQVYPASAQVLENGNILIFNREKFISVLERNPNLSFALIVRLSELLRKLNRLVEGLSLSDVTSRLAYYLIEELEAAPDGETIILTEKKSVLASQLGTIPETLSRSLAKLTKDNIIEVNRSEIKILDIDRLNELASGS